MLGRFVPLDEQLRLLPLKPLTTCGSYGYSQDIIPYGMLPNGKHTPVLRQRVYRWVDDMIEAGMESFLCPMEQGADLMVAERVIARRSVSGKPIRLIACLTHPDMGFAIHPLLREYFHSLCEQADETIFADAAIGGRSVRRILCQNLLPVCTRLLITYRGKRPPQILRDAKSKGIEYTIIEAGP
jgi:hypothetical protein